MKNAFYILGFLIHFIFNVDGLKAQHADCSKLLVLTDTIYRAKNISGFGEKMEFKNNFNDELSTFPQETNSIWYLINSPSTGKFTFDILSDNSNDDWDFLLYEHKNLFCKRIDSNKIKPIRTNLSRSANTGLSLTENELFSSPGVNNNYSKYVDVKEGQEFILVVNNPKRANGNHTLKLHFPETIKKEEVALVKEVVVTPKLDFTFDVKDAVTLQPVSANANLSGLLKEETELKDITNYQVILERGNYRVNLIVVAPDYMLYAAKIKIPKSKPAYKETILLERIEVGKKVSLEDIQFHAASDRFLTTAKGSLNALLIFMQQNTSITIEIEGHVNGPGQPNHQDFKQLSIDRAIAVKKFLTDNGIDESRIKYSGYGNSKMIFADPKTDDEHSMNRRVEIKILSK
jgi:outer membrane protein OmpA-like peptidoglycan-associated protein